MLSYRHRVQEFRCQTTNGKLAPLCRHHRHQSAPKDHTLYTHAQLTSTSTQYKNLKLAVVVYGRAHMTYVAAVLKGNIPAALSHN